MMHRPGPRLTLAQKTEVWRRWRQGESLSAIGRAPRWTAENRQLIDRAKPAMSAG